MVRIVLAVVMVAAMVGVVGLLVLPLVSAQDGPSATRSFDKTTVEPGGVVVVTIEVANYGLAGLVTETLPSGFTYESSSLAASEIGVTGQEISFFLIGTTSFRYTVTASSTTGSHRFSGILRDFEGDDYAVGGPSSVTVEATAEPAPSATRSFDKTTVEPGGVVVVTIAVANYGQGGGVTETLPGGFTYESSSLAASDIEVAGQNVSFILQGTTSFRYTVTASRTTGPHRFSGILRDFERDDYAVGGPSSVTVEATAEPAPSATRSFDKTTVEPGGVVVVTIAVANYGQGGGVTETLPGGFTYESSSLAASDIEVTGQNVSFILQGTTSFTYTVTASRTTGSHRFSGILRDFERDDYAVGGPSSVTVEATAEPAPSATRSFDKTTVEPGGVVVVTIAVANYGQGGGVTETLPGGFTYESSSLAASDIEVTGQNVSFILQGTTSFTYTVTASRTTGSHRFSGILRDFERDDYAVGGASSVTVRVVAPQPEPQVNRAPAFPGSSTTRSINENSASGANVGAAVRATDADGDTLTYALSGDDEMYFTIDNMGQIKVDADAMLDYETKSTYMVTVAATDPDSDSDSIMVTIMVTNVNEMGMVALSSMTPMVGVDLTATLTDPDVVVEGSVTWQWTRSMRMDGTFENIDGATSMSYTPVAGDVGYYLRATGMYTDGHGSGKDAMETTTAAVVTTGDPLVARYDANGNGTIEKSEVIKAINDYLFPPGGVEIITKADVIKLINLYLFPSSDVVDGVVERYDANGNGTIEKSEVIKAINDYLFPPGGVEIITKADVIKLINLYLFPPSDG